MVSESFVLLSKLQLPQINPRTLYRGRLINLIFQNIEKKLIVLCAGAGYGKTTLLSQFFAEAKMPFVYYHLEKEDNDPAVFLSHLIAGFRKINQGFGEKIQRLTQFYNLPERISGIVLGTFINEIIQTIKEDTFIILDDYHTLIPSSSIDSIISYFLTHLPGSLHFIISTRTELSISLAQLRARGEIFEMNTDIFRFTREEVQALLTALFSVKLSQAEIDWLYEHSEGWPACLRLMLQSYETVQGLKGDSFFKKLQDDYEKITRNIFDYFAREVFESESQENQQFLIDWSLLDYLNADICQVVSRRKDCHKILEEFSRRNAFIFSLPDGSYRVHSLFQEFLKNKLIDEKRKEEIYRRLGEYWYNINKDEALKYYILVQDFVSATKTIKLVAKKMLEQGKYLILCSSIEQLPEGLRNKNPLLLKCYGEALSYLGDLKEAKEILTKALNGSKKEPGLKAEIIYAFAGVNINEGNLKQARRNLLKVLKTCPKNFNLIKASALNSMGAINNTIGGKNLRQAKKYFKKAFKIAEKYCYQELKTSILNNWAMNEYKQGNLQSAYSKISQAVQLLKEHFSLGCGAGFFNGARIALLLGYTDDAEMILDSGLEVCKPFNDPWSQANIWRGYSLLCQQKNDLTKAREFINRALEIYEKLRIPYLIINTLTELCKVEILEEKFTEAQKVLNKIWELKKTKDAEAVSILMLQGQLKVAQEDYNEAEKIFAEANRLTRRYNLVLELFLINLAFCNIFYRQNRLNEAIRFLRRVITMTKNMGYDYLLLEELKKQSWLLKFIIKKNIENDYIFSLLRKSRRIYVINAFFFGVPRLYINGRQVKDGEWKTNKAKKLLFYLLLNKDKEINQDNLIEIFWKKSGLKQGYDSLRKAVYHIRQTLNGYNIEDPVLVHSGFYQISPDLYIISDIDDFEDLKKELEIEKKKGMKYKGLLNIYKNGFATGWYDNWAIEKADKYRQMFEAVMNRQKIKISQKFHKFIV